MMDGQRFDRLTRFVVTAASRRQTAWLLTGAALGGLLGLTEPGEATAGRCTKPGKACQKGDKCCGGGKCKRRRCTCTGGKLDCGDGRCEACCQNSDCPTGQTCCLNVHACKDVRNDPDFCGQCANGRCPGGAICANGNCGLTCTNIGEACFTGCFCAGRVDADHLNQKVCAGLGVFTCDTATTCTSDASCAPATEGFRQVCVGGLCPDKNVCADPCA